MLLLVSRASAALRATRWLLVSCGLAALASVALALAPRNAHALDKQGSAHGGEIGGADHGFGISGSLLFGAAVYNPSYAARPDNTGHALFRFAPHFDIDLIGSRLSIPVDINVFTDRDREGLGKLAPSELDLISGVTTTWPVGLTAVELGARVEGDFPVDREGKSQAYADVRGRLLYSVAKFAPSLSDALAGGDISGAATLGWFAYNPSYAARPDNTGLALFRYALRVNVGYTERFSFGVDATFFTDRHENPVAPSECDLTFEVAGGLVDTLQLHVAYERDMPIDREGLVQQFVLVFLTWDTTLVH